MENWHAYLIIALVFGVIISNMMVVKHLDKIKIPPLVKKPPQFPPPISEQLKAMEQQQANKEGATKPE
ncbi:DUF2897 family protein [uncultured Ferrimonas sp.]|uniref:DUF2897 family protein n=1 Tax=uncultured Ferrimonas sp. TaxID=432640 RepID=UPI00260CD2EE|nr:DUF2897 family protein [uncultured Ferrimonas sp.]